MKAGEMARQSPFHTLLLFPMVRVLREMPNSQLAPHLIGRRAKGDLIFIRGVVCHGMTNYACHHKRLLMSSDEVSTLIHVPTDKWILKFHPRYLLEEHLLDSPHVRSELGETLQAVQDMFGRDEFEDFPLGVRPQKHCAIIGGAGARSFLHR